MGLLVMSADNSPFTEETKRPMRLKNVAVLAGGLCALVAGLTACATTSAAATICRPVMRSIVPAQAC